MAVRNDARKNTMFSDPEVTNNGNRLEFHVHGVDVGVMNAIRRVILAEIPNVAINFDPYHADKSDIRILKNTTSLHNEFMGHRLSLIPIMMDANEIENFDAAEFTFKIDEHNNTNQVRVITTKHIQVYDSTGEKRRDVAKKLFPKDPITKEYIIITKLKPNNYNTQEGESFVAEFTLSKGKAKQHSRWCPVSTCTYQNLINAKAAKDALNSMIEHVSSKEEQERIKYKFKTLDIQRYFVKNEFDEPNAFHFKIESECKLSPAYLFDKALEILLQKVKELFRHQPNIHILHDSQKLYMIQVENEDHTIGNMFQSLAYTLFARHADLIDFIGYFQPHPLENNIVFKVKLTQDSTLGIDKTLEVMSERIHEHLQSIKDTWNTFADQSAIS